MQQLEKFQIFLTEGNKIYENFVMELRDEDETEMKEEQRKKEREKQKGRSEVPIVIAKNQ